jgi:hypothetical protein
MYRDVWGARGGLLVAPACAGEASKGRRLACDALDVTLYVLLFYDKNYTQQYVNCLILFARIPLP